MHPAPPHEPPRHALRESHKSPRSPRADRAGAAGCSPSRAREGPGEGLSSNAGRPPARPLRQMAFARHRPPHPLGAQLDASAGRSAARARSSPRRLADQASCAAPSGSHQLADQREAVEAEAGVERRAPCRPAAAARCAGIARRQSGLGRGLADLAVDAVTPGTRAAARPAAAAPSSRDQRSGPAGRAPGPPPPDRRPARPAEASLRGGGSHGVAVSGSGLRPSARSSASSGLSASRNRRASDRRGTPASAPMVLRPSRSSVRVGPGGSRSAATGKRRELRRRASVGRSRSALRRRTAPAPTPRPAVGAIATRRVSPSAANRACDILDQPRLAAEQMRDPADVEPQAIRAVDLDQRRPARRPARQPLDQRRIARRIGRHRDQPGIERARIGQPRAGPRAALRRRLGHGMDHRPVRRPRRSATTGVSGDVARRSSCASARSPAAATRSKAIRVSGFGVMRDAPPAGREARARGTARRPTPARPARADRTDWAGTARSRSASASAPRSDWRAPPEPHQPGRPRPIRSAATASRRVAVKSSAAGSPHSSPITAPSAAHLKPSSIAHSAERASRAATWMRSVPTAKARRINPPRLEDRHPLLHPQQRLAARPTARAGTRPPPSRGWRRTVRDSVGRRRRGQAPALAQSARDRTLSSRPRGRTVRPPPATRDKPARHTTHNVYVLLFVLIPQVRGRSQWRNSLSAFANDRALAFGEEFDDLGDRLPSAARLRHRKAHVARSRSRPPCRARRRSRAPRAPRRSRRAATRRPASAPAACPDCRGNGGWSTGWPAIHS